MRPGAQRDEAETKEDRQCLARLAIVRAIRFAPDELQIVLKLLLEAVRSDSARPSIKDVRNAVPCCTGKASKLLGRAILAVKRELENIRPLVA